MWSFTGSSAVAAETVHSIADLSNQYLLRVGILASQRRPTEAHPYGKPSAAGVETATGIAKQAQRCQTPIYAK